MRDQGSAGVTGINTLPIGAAYGVEIYGQRARAGTRYGSVTDSFGVQVAAAWSGRRSVWD